MKDTRKRDLLAGIVLVAAFAANSARTERSIRVSGVTVPLETA